jgi:hypothetical protein
VQGLSWVASPSNLSGTHVLTVNSTTNAVSVTDTYTVSYVGVLALEDNNTGNVIYLGLIAGGTVSSGSVAIVSSQMNGSCTLTC